MALGSHCSFGTLPRASRNGTPPSGETLRFGEHSQYGLFAFDLAHEPCQARHVDDPEVGAFPADETHRRQPAQLPGHRLAMRADAFGDVGKRRSRGEQRASASLAASAARRSSSA